MTILPAAGERQARGVDVTRWFLSVSPSGLQKVARRNCASSLVEQAVAHAGGVGAVVPPAQLAARAVGAAPGDAQVVRTS